ncbi:MAG: hypothetical protein AAGF83_01540 [Cyanobacteria bacterium P01_G01_bin.67]
MPSAQLGIDFVDIANELENNDADGNGLPDYLSADVTRILAGVDGELTLETGGKGNGHIGPNNPDGTLTHATHLEDEEARMDQPDGLQWIKTSEGDYLVVDEDSGNDYGERKYVLPIDAETMQLREEGTGYYLASAGGALNPRAIAEVAAIPDTFTRATSSEFSGTWNVTHLVQTKEDGSFYTQEELAGTGAQEIIEQFSLDEQTLIGVVQHRGESDGVIEQRQGDQGGQIFQFNIDGIPEGESVAEEDGDITGVAGLDTLTGASGADTFILGDEETGAFYSSFGYDDFAEISHFVSGEDSIQLAGSLEDYSILVNEGANVAIALDNDGDGAFDLAFDEFVALVGDGFETTDLVFV